MVIPIAIMKHMTIHPFASKKEKGQFSLFLLLNPASVFVVELSEDKDKKEQENNCGFAYLKSQYCESLSQVTIPIRRILAPATIQTMPAVINNTCLFTPYFMIYITTFVTIRIIVLKKSNQQ